MIQKQEKMFLFPPDSSLITSSIAPNFAKFTIIGDKSDKILHVEVTKADAIKTWAVNVQTPLFPKISKDDLLEVSFQMRCLRSRNEDTCGMSLVYMQVDRGEWEALGQIDLRIPSDGEWRTYHIGGKAKHDFAAETVNVIWHTATVEQILEIRAVVGNNLGNQPISLIPITLVDYVGRDKNAPWRSEATKRIEKHRKGMLNISVVDKAGKSVPNAEITVTLKRHAYAFGSSTDAIINENNSNADKYRQIMQETFNRITIPWCWADWGLENPKEHASYHRIAKWAQKSGFEIRADCLIYPLNLPANVRKMTKEARYAAIFEQIKKSMAETKSYNAATWGVLNELRHDTFLEEDYGFGIYADIFKAARQSNPKSVLYINENSVEAIGSARNSAIAIYEKQIAQMIKEGAPLGGIGVQGHFGGDLPSPESVWKALDRLAKFGLPIEITEFDICNRDEAAQADYIRDYITTCFAHPATTGITLWGFWEGSIWRKDSALIREDWTPKPGWHALTTLIQKTWHTKTSGRTKTDGKFTTNAFYGTYDVTVKVGDKATKVTIAHQKGVTKTLKIIA
jgi:endo-1,4-beta-xylanase